MAFAVVPSPHAGFVGEEFAYGAGVPVTVVLLLTTAAVGHGVQARWDAHLSELLGEGAHTQRPQFIIAVSVQVKNLPDNARFWLEGC